jgi:hypothetical protein
MGFDLDALEETDAAWLHYGRRLDSEAERRGFNVTVLQMAYSTPSLAH